MGLRDATIEWRLPETFPPLPPSELDQPQLEQLAAQQRLDLAIARRELEARGTAGAAGASGGARATPNIDVHYEREPSGEHTVGPGIELPIPIFNTGRAARTRAEARVPARAARAERAHGRIVVATAHGARHAERGASARRVLPRRRPAAPTPHRRADASSSTTPCSSASSSCCRRAQNEAQAQSDFIEAQREYWSARTNLDRALQGIAEGGN